MAGRKARLWALRGGISYSFVVSLSFELTLVVFESDSVLHRGVHTDTTAIAAREGSDGACEGPKGRDRVGRSREIVGDIGV